MGRRRGRPARRHAPSASSSSPPSRTSARSSYTVRTLAHHVSTSPQHRHPSSLVRRNWHLVGVDDRRGLPCAPAALFPVAFGLGEQSSIVVGTAACTLLDPAAPVLKLTYLNDATCVEQWMVDTLSPTLARIIGPPTPSRRRRCTAGTPSFCCNSQRRRAGA